MQKKYRHKLNMLEPGAKMCTGIGLGLIISFISWLAGCYILTVIAGAIASILTVLLFILIIIEAHQDKVLYEEAKKSDPDIK
ncbi:MAG TPA: hypothetical protein VN258_03580 [Mobilitalea sp.]|nr:hypothetical protein [Mobilitalea sp.]